MATDEELERFYAGFTRTTFAFPPVDGEGERPAPTVMVPPSRRRRRSQWDHDDRLPPVPSYIRFDEDGEGYDSRVGRSRKRPRSLHRRGSLERTSITRQMRLAVERLRELEASSDDPLGERQVRMTLERLHRDGVRVGMNVTVLDRLARGEDPYPRRAPAPVTVPDPVVRMRQRRLDDDRRRPTPAELWRQAEALRQAR